MPRNGSSVYSLPAGNPVIPGTTIATAWANGTLTDIATALTQSLSTDGSTASVSMSGKTLVGGTYNGPAVTGTLTLTGGQIAFPAVQVPSANPNTLDDYEEGTFTPTLTTATPGTLSIGYATRVGAYTKVGNVVNYTIRITTSSFTVGTASGQILITGLPFSDASSSPGSFGRIVGLTTTSQTWFVLIAATTQIQFFIVDASASATTVIASAPNFVVGAVKDFMISCTSIV